MKPSLRYKIQNELKKADYVRLTEFLSENKSASIELFPGMNLEFMSVNPLVVTVKGLGYLINGGMSLQHPIGLEVYDHLKLEDEACSLAVNSRKIKLSKVVKEASGLERDLNKCLKILERLVNHTCIILDEMVEQTFTLDSNWLDQKLEVEARLEELEKRGEVPRPFGMVHAKSSKDAKERAGDLVPIYMERDKAYLYEDKKVFVLLPRNFVMKLLKLEGSAMMPTDLFTDEEIEVLKKFSMRQYVKARKVGGKICYYDLDETTRKLLLKGVRKR